MSTFTTSRRRNSTASASASSDDAAAPRSPPNGYAQKDNSAAPFATASAAAQVHREWQKMRYSRRSVATLPGSPSESGASTPVSERTSPIASPMHSSTASPPKPSFMNWSQQSPLALPTTSRPPTYISPLAEWALSGRTGIAH